MNSIFNIFESWKDVSRKVITRNIKNAKIVY
jgi:hypothetical protein